ncbi:helix-turn-helix transcriptional regulator [Stenotrophomonas sp. HMWF003]|uniref:AraC family transcriptional regulator n=1 Tax=Stenotrophomonas sp. HMWF003 TaxID=2056840 RepID=UPI000D3F51FD|nr:helix-turn-helix transcriptional regulator [Stenotrophomonas sp. HMWF003]PTT65526.1 AraC family transcriptional regulator [Stenotrophomonas sp. HMWF003]
MNNVFRPEDAIALPPVKVRHDVLDWLERDDGLAVLGFQIESARGLDREIDWHQHRRAQLISVEAGLLNIRTRHGNWSLPPGCAGWMPPGEPHTVGISGPLRGWGLIVSADMAHDLPDQPCVVAISDLLQALAMRVIRWAPAAAPDLRQQHMIEVLLDEIRNAPRQRMHLPMPQDRRLLRIASQLIANPADGRSLEQWAHWAGLSPRSLTRHFRDETTLSFAQWRQQARLADGLRRLSDGHSVSDIAHELGFSSPSAFVTVFRRHFGCPPGRYLARSGQPLNPTRGLASPAASG